MQTWVSCKLSAEKSLPSFKKSTAVQCLQKCSDHPATSDIPHRHNNPLTKEML